jgi:hypothetical protein
VRGNIFLTPVPVPSFPHMPGIIPYPVCRLPAVSPPPPMSICILLPGFSCYTLDAECSLN